MGDRMSMPEEINFVLDYSLIKSMEFRPHMVEVAYDYVCLAEKSQKNEIQEVLSALSLEILFKSYSSRAVENIGKINEKYDFCGNLKPHERHDLKKLWDLLPKEIQMCLLRWPHDLEEIEKKRHTFLKGRYMYEKGHTGSHSDRLIRIARFAIFKTIMLYREKGCKDPFIENCSILEEMKALESQGWFLQDI